MSLKTKTATTVARLASLGMRKVFKRDATMLPGAIAERIAGTVPMRELADRLSSSVCVIGTNGKTTVNNLIADTIANAGYDVVCNRKGSNMTSGVTSALVEGKPDGKIGVFECDELYSRFVIPAVKPNVVVLLNLFRDQLDRSGEIDKVQDAIASGIAECGNKAMRVLYNADDPLVTKVVMDERIAHVRKTAFGIGDPMPGTSVLSDRVAMECKCPSCGSELEYSVRQYAQLGTWRCPSCGCERPNDIEFAARDVESRDGRTSFMVSAKTMMRSHRATMACSGAYMVYNMLAVYAAVMCMGLVRADGAYDMALSSYEPMNGRQSHLTIGGVPVTVNLAKNPTGMNQNIGIIAAERGTRKSLTAVIINDRDVDGRDVSWLWDVDFERLADANTDLMVGGTRADDMLVRARYAEVPCAGKFSDIEECVRQAINIGYGRVYVLTNYSPLLPTMRRLRELEKKYDR